MSKRNENPYSADGQPRKRPVAGLWLALIVVAAALLAVIWNLMH